jgi:DNA adenine methylase|nr:MAG: putative cysteine protease [Lake Baikal virophage 1]
MPYEIRKFPDGYKVCKKETDTCFSNKPIPLKNAVAQRKAIGMSGGEMSGGAMVIKAPKYGKIEIGIPSMYYKDKLIDALTRLKALTTRKGNKSIILEETNGNDIIIENDGTPEKGGVAFHSIRIKVPKTLIKIKTLKKGEKEVEVPTLTNISKNLTMRTKIRSIKFKTVEGDKVKVITNEDNVDIVYSGVHAPQLGNNPISKFMQGKKEEEEDVPELETVYRPSRVMKPALIPNPQGDYEKEINKLVKFSLGHVNFDDFSRELLQPPDATFVGKGSTSDLKTLLFMYYMTLKYKNTLVYSFSDDELSGEINWFNYFNQIDMFTGKIGKRELYQFPFHKNDDLYRNGKKIKVAKKILETNKVQINSDNKTIISENIRLKTDEFDRLYKTTPTDLLKDTIIKIKNIVKETDKQIIFNGIIGGDIKDGSGKSNSTHASLVLIRPKWKEVYSLDPHGNQGLPTFEKSVYPLQHKYLNELATELGYKYIPSGTICPYISGATRVGFQALDSMFQYAEYEKKHGKRYDKKDTNSEGLEGFCGYWTYFLIELALQEPDKNMKDVLGHAGRILGAKPETVFNVMVKYQASVSGIINEIAKSENINLPKMVVHLDKEVSGVKPLASRGDYKEANTLKLIKTVSENMTRLYYLQKEKLGYGDIDKKYEKLIYHTDLTGAGISANSGFYRTDPKRLTGGDYFDDEDWNAIIGATKEGGDIDWWGIAKDVGSDLIKQGSDYISKLGETEEQKEARIKKEEACKLCNEKKDMWGGVRPFFGRMGGKSKIAKKLIGMFPDDYKTFVEPFVGAGNIFWRLDHKPDIKYVINDFDPNVVKIFRSLKKGDKCLEDAGGLISQAEFNKLREKDNKTGCEQATYVRNSFFSMGKSYSHAKDIKSYESERLKEAKEILKNVTVLNKSFEKVIKEYDSATTFFYLDPPYESERQKDYDDYVTPEQVYNGVKGMKGRFMISYNDSPNIRKIFKEYNISFTSTEYAHTQYIKKRKIGEVIITNYATKKGGDIDWSALGNIAYDYLIKPNQKEPQKLNKRKEGDDERNWGYDEEETLPPEQPHFVGDPTQFKPQPYDPNNPLMYMGGSIPINKKLYEKAKAEVYPKYKKPSAYRSGALIKRYKELGGKFKERGERKLARWFEEDWRDIGNKNYPVYRPSNRITKDTPLTPSEIDPANLQLQISEKQKIKGDKNLKPFVMKGGELYAKDKYKTGEKELTPTEKKLVKKEMGEGNPEIEEIQREPMGDDDIKKYFPQAKILKYSELRNYSDIKQLLPKLKSFFFLLYERSPNVGHWVLVSRYNDNGLDTVEFFCSYGSKVDQPLTWTPIGMRVQLGEDKPLLSQLLDKSNLRVIYNPVQYQSKRSNIATCGAYDTLRASELVKHNTTLEEYNEMLSEVKKGTGLTFDEIVSNLIDMR